MVLYAYRLALDAEQERTEGRMAVNPPGLFLKRCQQAQAVHGNDSSPTSPAEPVRMGKDAVSCTGQILWKARKQWLGDFR